jgi:hypothetical protein
MKCEGSVEYRAFSVSEVFELSITFGLNLCKNKHFFCTISAIYQRERFNLRWTNGKNS